MGFTSEAPLEVLQVLSAVVPRLLLGVAQNAGIKANVCNLRYLLITVRNSSYGKVVFTSVCHSVHGGGGGACVVGGMCGAHGRGCMHGRGCAWRGCV